MKSGLCFHHFSWGVNTSYSLSLGESLSGPATWVGEPSALVPAPFWDHAKETKQSQPSCWVAAPPSSLPPGIETCLSAPQTLWISAVGSLCQCRRGT